jgi:alanine dehydrogenase
MVLLVNEREVTELLNMKQALTLVAQASVMHAKGRIGTAPRLALKLDGEAGSLRVMMASLPETGSFGLKTLTGIPGRRERGKTYFVILLFDSGSGALVAILSAGHLTNIRTGAAGGVAAQYLARSDAETLGVFGAGVQARFQVEAITSVFPIKKMKVFTTNGQRAAQMADEYRQRGLDAIPVRNSHDVITSSDILVCATTATEPIIRGDWLPEGTHINAIGANSTVKRELDAAVFLKAKVIVDFAEQVCLEAGDVVDALASGTVSKSQFQTELGDVLIGSKRGRSSPDEITIFKSVGAAFLDVAIAAWVYKEALTRGLGQKVNLES